MICDNRSYFLNGKMYILRRKLQSMKNKASKNSFDKFNLNRKQTIRQKPKKRSNGIAVSKPISCDSNP